MGNGAGMAEPSWTCQDVRSRLQDPEPLAICCLHLGHRTFNLIYVGSCAWILTQPWAQPLGLG